MARKKELKAELDSYQSKYYKLATLHSYCKTYIGGHQDDAKAQRERVLWAQDEIKKMNKLIDVLTRDHTLDLDTYRIYWNSARHADDDTPDFGQWLAKKYEEDVAKAAQQASADQAKKRLGIK